MSVTIPGTRNQKTFVLTLFIPINKPKEDLPHVTGLSARQHLQSPAPVTFLRTRHITFLRSYAMKLHFGPIRTLRSFLAFLMLVASDQAGTINAFTVDLS
jgi:hypothetical protein